MDVTPYMELSIAPRAVFDSLTERGSDVRFMIPTPDGDWRPVTWNEFAGQIRQCAMYLGSEMESGERAAIFAPNRVEWASAALGIQAMGGVMIPIYGSSTAEQAAYVIEHGDARVVFVDTEAMLTRLLEAWPRLEGVRRVVLLDDSLDLAAALQKLKDAGKPAPEPDEVERKTVHWTRALSVGAARDQEDPGAFERTMDAVDLDQFAMMLYTSGTSGNPKGVPLTHRNVSINGLDWMQANAPLLEENAVDLMWLPMSHIFGFGEVCLGNTLGFTTYMTDPVQVLNKLPEVQPSVFMSVPSVWEKLAMSAMDETDPERQKARLDEATGGRLKFCLSGGAGLKREVKELLHDNGILVIEGYGLTECSPTLTLNRPDAYRFDSVGKPFPSVEVKLADDGEILARGPSVFSGYHKNPEATREVFTDDGWFKTGDIGRFTEDGFLQIVDRKKDILVTAGGKNVAPANIEMRFRDDPYIDHVVVYGDGRKYLVAGVWVNEGAVKRRLESDGVASEQWRSARDALVQERIDQVNEQLARHETIKRFRVFEEPLTIDRGFLTPTLKVKRKKVYEHFGPQLEELYQQ
jgi:long-chain acyl-CoA synthetase